MKQYEEYKDSGILAVGSVPSDWKVVPIKYVLEQSANGIKIGPFGSTLTGKVSCEHFVKVYGQWNVIGKDFTAGKNYVSEETYQKLESYWIHPNDILISMMGTVGKCAIIPTNVPKGIMDSHIVKVRLNEMIIDPHFFYYVYDKDGSNVVISQILRERRGSIMDGLNSTLIKSFIIPLPSIAEQQSIVSYLNYKVGQIDAVIAEKEQLLEDLKAYRSAIISEAVTKGLDKNVEMKDSGIEWLGMIPKHWKIVKLAWAYPNVGSGTTPDTNNNAYYAEQGINWLQTGDLNDGIIIKTSKHITEYALKDRGLRIYPKGSLVIAMYGATIGKVGLLNIETTVNQACCVLPPTEKMSNIFTKYVLQTAKDALLQNSAGGGQPNISQAIIKALSIPIPPLEEQNHIVEFLEDKDSSIKSSIEDIHSQIEDLKAYKSSLITEAVTGKVDLRDWKPNTKA